MFILILLTYYKFTGLRIKNNCMRGSVIRLISVVLDREFESVETSSGFARLLGENWVFWMVLEKTLLSNESLEMNVAISRKKLQFHKVFYQSTQKVNEKPQNWQCGKLRRRGRWQYSKYWWIFWSFRSKGWNCPNTQTSSENYRFGAEKYDFVQVQRLHFDSRTESYFGLYRMRQWRSSTSEFNDFK